MAKIAISYRRSDQPAVAHLLYERLKTRYVPIFGDHAVYIDVIDGRHGEDYDVQFNNALKQCAVMLAIMGPNWVGGSEPGHSRITDSDDPIRKELEIARQLGIPILPVLVEGAEMVKASKLPKELKNLPKINAAHVQTGRHLARDVQDLIDHLDKRLDVAGAPVPAAGVAPPRPAGQAAPRAPAGDLPAGGLLQALRARLSFGVPRARSWQALSALLLIAMATVLGAWIWTRPAVFDLASGKPWSGPGKMPGHAGTENAGGLGALTVRPLTKGAAELHSIAFAAVDPAVPGPVLMAVAGDDGVVRLWNTESFKLEREIAVRKLVGAGDTAGSHKIAFSALGDLIYVTGLDNKIHAFDIATRRPAGALTAEPNSAVSLFRALAVFPRPEEKNRYVAGGGDDGCFRIWHVSKPAEPIVSKYVTGGPGRLNEKCVQPVKAEPDGGVQSIAYASDGKGLYAVGNRDGTIFFFSEQREPRNFKAHDGHVSHLEFSPDGDFVASAGADHRIHVWRFSDATKPYRTLTGHTNIVSSLTWNADGSRLISGSEDKTMRMWDVAASQQVGAPFLGHREDVAAVAFDPKGRWIFSASQDGMLKVWNPAAREATLTMIAYADGKHIVYHRNGMFMGSKEAAPRIIITYRDGDVEKVLPEDQKARLYRTPDEFAKSLAGAM